MKTTPIKRSWSADSLSKDFVMDEAAKKFTADSLVQALKDRGFTMDESALNDPKVLATMKSMVTKDAALALGNANIPAYLQFFQHWRPEVVRALYRGRTAEKAFDGVDQVGDWTTEQIIVQFLELTGDFDLYDDFSRATLSSYNIGYDKFDTLRLETNIEVTKLEEATASVMRQNAKQLKNEAQILNMDVGLNLGYWFGFNIEGRKIPGVVNHPQLATRKDTLAVDPMASATTVKQIQDMFNDWFANLANDLQGNFDITSEKIRVLLPLKWTAALSRATDSFGWSVKKWLGENYKNVEISFHPELDDADEGDPMAIVYAPEVNGVGMKTISLQQTSKLHLIGAIPTLKGMQESYSASIAGAVVAAPLAVKMYA